LRLKIVHNF